jgi:phage host-nuclease inhibitor protein Gam
MTKAKMKRQAEQAPVPQDRAEAERALARLGEIQRSQAVTAKALEETIAQAKTKADEEARPLVEEAALLTRGLEIWATANRLTLTDGNRTKTVKLAGGEIAWRSKPPSVKLKDVPSVVSALVSLGLERFLRRKVEVNKEAMLAEPAIAATVAGVTIASDGEEFVVTPVTVQPEAVA